MYIYIYVYENYLRGFLYDTPGSNSYTVNSDGKGLSASELNMI